MEIIDRKEFDRLEFADHPIEKMEIDFLKKEMIISTLGACVKINEEWKDFEKAEIKIFNWEEIKISMYDSSKKKWTKILSPNFDPLKEICELVVNSNFTICGFGKKSGFWIQYEVISPNFNVILENML